MLHKKYVVTGIGAVCSLGNNVEEVWENVISGKSGISALKKVDTTHAYTNKGAEIKDFKLTKKVDKRIVDKMDYASLICLEAVDEALKKSKLNLAKENKDRIGVIMGSCTGGFISSEKVNRDLLSKDKEVNPDDILKIPVNKIARNIAHVYGVTGISANISNACAATNIAIGYACDLIERNELDAAIIGGTDSLDILQFAGFHSLHALAEEGCAPFSKSDGINLGEGAGALIIESYEHALQRKADILCEAAGYGVTCDANHITAPREDGAEQIKAMETALKYADLKREDVDYLNAHGTGTALNDKIERASINNFYGSSNIKVSSTKSMTGHCLGASSALEAVFCIKAIESNIMPPTINFQGDKDDRFIADQSIEADVKTAMSNAFAFGGSNASVVFTEERENLKQTPIERNDEKVLITGIGTINSLGKTMKEYADNVNNNVTAVKKAEYEEGLYRGSYEAGISFDKGLFKDFPRKFVRRLDRLSKLLLYAGCQALADGQLEINEDIEEKIGLIAGTSDGPIGDIREFQETVITEGIKEANAAIFPNTVYNASAGYLAICKKIKGHTATMLNGISSGIDSLCYAYDLLKLGRCDYFLASGSDEYNETAHFLYDKCGLLASETDDNGIVLSEGSSVFLLEKESTAKKRNAKVYAEAAGYEILNCPCLIDEVPSSEMLEKVIVSALRKSDMDVSDVDCIVGFGNGLKSVDQFEMNVYKNVFKDKLKDIEIQNIKKLTGEGRAAVSALQILHGAAVLNGLINLKNSKKNIKNVLITSFSFGGGVSALILKKAEN